jgi:hypothetical protein
LFTMALTDPIARPHSERQPGDPVPKPRDLS